MLCSNAQKRKARTLGEEEFALYRSIVTAALRPQIPYTCRPVICETLCRVSALAIILCVHSGTPIFSNTDAFPGRGGGGGRKMAMRTTGNHPKTDMSARQKSARMVVYVRKPISHVSHHLRPKKARPCQQESRVRMGQLRSPLRGHHPGLAGTQRVIQVPFASMSAHICGCVARLYLPGKALPCTSKTSPRIRPAMGPSRPNSRE